jgi:hypothetical protein
MKELIFTTEIDGMTEILDARPKPAREFIPKWYKNIPADIPERSVNPNFFVSKLKTNFKTAKTCPSFPSVFNEGYIVTAPCDIHLGFVNNQFFMDQSNKDIWLELHDHDQMTNHIPGRPIRGIFKITTRWQCIAPKGYSVRYLPLFWDFNKDWTASYGVIEHDKMHQLNVQLLYTSDKDEILIKQGTPLVQLVPFKREDFKYTIKDMTTELQRKINVARLSVLGRYKAGYLKHEI